MQPSQRHVFAESRETPGAERTPGASIDGKRVLVAEDEPGARRAMASMLREVGLDVVESEDGGRMLVAVTSHYKRGLTPADLDLIITDVHMPVLDGLDVFRGVRSAHWATPTTPHPRASRNDECAAGDGSWKVSAASDSSTQG